MSKFYDPNKLLCMRDLDGEVPEIFMCEGNRTAGKTFAFKWWCVKRFLRHGEKFMVLYRYSYELDGAADAFFKDLEQIKLPGHVMTADWCIRNVCLNLYLDKKHCGYAMCMSNPDVVKKKSATFVDVARIFMDEYQSESGKYLPNELDRFQSIHMSVARGGGKHTRYVPVYMASNGVTIFNPYSVAFGFSSRIKSCTKFIRGKGVVMERTFNQNAADAINESAFARAFAGTTYQQYATGDTYMLDDNNFIGKYPGRKWPEATIKYHGEMFGLWLIKEKNLHILSRKFDPSIKAVITGSLGDHAEGTYFAHAGNMLKILVNLYDTGRIFFEDGACKNAFIDTIGYNRFKIER